MFQERADTSGRPDAALQYSICDRRGAAIVGGSCVTRISLFEWQTWADCHHQQLLSIPN